jgi:hypothetical protein
MQIEPTSPTQVASQDFIQHAGSLAQICAEQGVHAGASGAPVVHGSCEHGSPPQTPPPHLPSQHCPPSVHALPSGAHAPHVPSMHDIPQQSVAVTQLDPSGAHIPPQTPFEHDEEQQIAAEPHFDPSGAHSFAHAPSTQTLLQH